MDECFPVVLNNRCRMFFTSKDSRLSFFIPSLNSVAPSSFLIYIESPYHCFTSTGKEIICVVFLDANNAHSIYTCHLFLPLFLLHTAYKHPSMCNSVLWLVSNEYNISVVLNLQVMLFVRLEVWV